MKLDRKSFRRDVAKICEGLRRCPPLLVDTRSEIQRDYDDERDYGWSIGNEQHES